MQQIELFELYALPFDKQRLYYKAYLKLVRDLNNGYYLAQVFENNVQSHYAIYHIDDMKSWRFYEGKNEWGNIEFKIKK
ncbi:TPA: hypothetical protein OMD75_005085 [Klebsiella oxytoca]|nr:hypothetical protein [Klebsiella oxytoca]